jgi:hypothetical protein
LLFSTACSVSSRYIFLTYIKIKHGLNKLKPKMTLEVHFFIKHKTLDDSGFEIAGSYWDD